MGMCFFCFWGWAGGRVVYGKIGDCQKWHKRTVLLTPVLSPILENQNQKPAHCVCPFAALRDCGVFRYGGHIWPEAPREKPDLLNVFKPSRGKMFKERRNNRL